MIALVGVLCALVGKIAPDEVTSLPGLTGALSSKQYSGYFDLPASSGGGPAGKHLHYWMVESENDPKNDPVVFWFNGGPGCSSLDGYFYEHGPYHVVEPVVNTSAGVPTLYQNPNRWSQIANVVFLEAPAGVGFSYADTKNGTVHTDTTTAEDNFAALQLFYKGYPEFASNDLFISGESYAGAYVPMLALQVIAHNNKTTTDAAIPLQGILVGNGVTGQGSIPHDVAKRLDVEFLFGHGLFSSLQHDTILKACGDYKTEPNQPCDAAISAAHDSIGNVNVYNIYSKCVMAMDDDGTIPPTHWRAPPDATLRDLVGRVGGPDGCINAKAAAIYLDHPDVQAAIHVTQAKKPWHICGGVEYHSDQGSLLPDYKATLIPNIRVLIFNGDVDCCVPYKGNEWWTSSLGLPVVKAWRPWSVDQQVAGYVTTYANGFNFLTVKGAGHMVPQFKPAIAFAMFERMIKNVPFDQDGHAEL
jgi:serine carboxypeptidase-like clade 1